MTRKQDFHLLPDVASAIRRLQTVGLQVVVVTNQSGIARGFLTEDGLGQIHDLMKEQLAEGGADLDAVYYCPHHPEHGIGDYKQDCECRKPKPGMFISARDFLKIDMANSVMIGDKAEDMMAAEAAGVGTRVLVRTGKPVIEKGEALASVVLDSIKDVPAYLKG